MDISVGGGTKKLKYFINTGYYNEKGIISNTGFQRLNTLYDTGRTTNVPCGLPVVPLRQCTPRVIILDINTGFTFLPTFGSDNNHTVRRTRTVDSCRSGILQNLHSSDILNDPLNSFFNVDNDYLDMITSTAQKDQVDNRS